MNPPLKRTVLVFDHIGSLADEVIRRWGELARSAVRSRGVFTVALSGGETPQRAYERLGSGTYPLPWDEMHVFLADERLVSRRSQDSNFSMIRALLLDRVAVPSRNVHAVRPRGTAESAAGHYQDEILASFGLKRGEFPRFDLVMLGIGQDGHTASLFPGAASLREMRLLAVGVTGAPGGLDRVSLTLPVINNSREVMFIATGRGKAEIVRDVMAGDPALPAALVRPGTGGLTFLLDTEAAWLLPRELWTEKQNCTGT